MFLLKSPKQDKTPLIISFPHAGTQIPDKLRASFLSADPLFLTYDSDLYVDELYHAAVELEVPILVQTINRYVIDLNRDEKVIDASFVQGAPEITNPPFLGLVSHKTTKGIPLIKEPISPKQLQERIKKYYQPFHDKLSLLIAEKKKRFGYCIHIDAHSMPSKAALGHIDEGERADVVPGNQDGTSCSEKLTKAVIDYFLQQGLSCKPNIPYKGGFITQYYGKPKEKVHTIQIELNRKLYMNEETHERLPGKFEGLQETLRGLIISILKIKL